MSIHHAQLAGAMGRPTWRHWGHGQAWPSIFAGGIQWKTEIWMYQSFPH